MDSKKKKYQSRVKRGLALGNRYHYIYLKADTHLIVNDNDPDLESITIPLPDAPDIRLIDNYGLAPTQQFWRRPEIPSAIKELQKRHSTVDDCIKEIRENPSRYKSEIEFIEREHARIRIGHWFFNNGKPTYISGNHYAYLTYWRAGGKHPEYRSRDRKFFLFDDFVGNDEFACGFNYPKFRREGATSKVSCIVYFDTIKNKISHAGIQSKDRDSAETVFQKHIVLNWKRLPFFFKPVYDGTSDPKNELKFFPPPSGSGRGGAMVNVSDSLESWIDFGPSTEGYYDGDKLSFYYGDEVGKTEEADVYLRHTIIKPALTEGNKYIGRCINTSTVGNMEKRAGKAFRHLCSLSHYQNRNENNETVSGLYNLFISSADGFDLVDKSTGKRFIDKYGNSDIEACTKYLLNRREAFLKVNDMNGLAEEIRQYPLYFRECFRSGAKDCNFNINILENRLDRYRFGNEDIIRGNFEWSRGEKDTEVIWKPSPQGKFYISYIPPSSLQNKFTFEMGVRVPANSDRFAAGGDPYKYRNVKHEHKKSLGGGAVFYSFDPSVDDPAGDESKWVSDDFVCTYLDRPQDPLVYAEDMLMMCIFYGCYMNPEINVSLLWDHFVDRGYGGYLFYNVNQSSGRYEKTPGSTTQGKVQEKIYSLYEQWIQRSGHRSKQDRILDQCKDIEDDMGPYDLFVAGGYALMASEKAVKKQEQTTDYQTYIRKYKRILS